MTLKQPFGKNPGAIRGGVTLGESGPLSTGGAAMAFDGSTGYVALAAGDLYPTTVAFAREAWVKTAGAGNPDGWEWIANYLNASGNGAWCGIQPNGAIDYTVVTGLNYTPSGPSLYDDQWHHLVWVYDNGNLTLYVDSIVVGSYSGVAAPQSGGVSAIGQRADSTEYFAGVLAEVAIYDTALTATRVAAHYSAASSTDPLAYPNAVRKDKPVSYWRLDETSGLWVHDSMLKSAT